MTDPDHDAYLILEPGRTDNFLRPPGGRPAARQDVEFPITKRGQQVFRKARRCGHPDVRVPVRKTSHRGRHITLENAGACSYRHLTGASFPQIGHPILQTLYLCQHGTGMDSQCLPERS